MTSKSGKRQVYSTVMTANRTITLPSDSGMKEGMEIEVVRNEGGTICLLAGSSTPYLGKVIRFLPLPKAVCYQFHNGSYIKLSASTFA
jgi:hypothetical protein